MNSPPIHVQIRPMNSNDLDQVLEIDQVSFSLPWPRNAFEYELQENPLSLLWVAEANFSGGERQVVGLIVLWMILDEAHIATFAVHPAFRRQGIATRLLVTALRAVREKGAVLATLEVRTSNVAAQGLYRSFGFDIAGHRRHYYHDNNEDAYIMTLEKLDEAYMAWLESGERQKPGH